MIFSNRHHKNADEKRHCEYIGEENKRNMRIYGKCMYIGLG